MIAKDRADEQTHDDNLDAVVAYAALSKAYRAYDELLEGKARADSRLLAGEALVEAIAAEIRADNYGDWKLAFRGIRHAYLAAKETYEAAS